MKNKSVFFALSMMVMSASLLSMEEMNNEPADENLKAIIANYTKQTNGNLAIINLAQQEITSLEAEKNKKFKDAWESKFEYWAIGKNVLFGAIALGATYAFGSHALNSSNPDHSRTMSLVGVLFCGYFSWSGLENAHEQGMNPEKYKLTQQMEKLKRQSLEAKLAQEAVNWHLLKLGLKIQEDSKKN